MKSPALNTAESFQVYRSYIELNPSLQSIEVDGIFDTDDFATIVTDAATVTMRPQSDRPEIGVPLLTPLDRRANWFNLDYYGRLLGQDRPLIYYNHLSGLMRENPGAYREVLAQPLNDLADQKGVLVFDRSGAAEQIETELMDVLASLGIDHENGFDGHETDTEHQHYASKGSIVGGARNTGGIEAMYQGYEIVQELGGFNSGKNVFVTARLPEGQIEQSWGFYKKVFAKLSKSDPVFAGLTEQEFTAVMQDPKYLKAVYISGSSIVNFCLLTDVRNCSWMNQTYYSSQFPAEYEDGEVLCCPGIIRNPDVRDPQPMATSGHTIGIIGLLAAVSRTEPVITFACNSVSNRQVPGLSETFLAQEGRGLVTQTSQPVGSQVFRALELNR